MDFFMYLFSAFLALLLSFCSFETYGKSPSQPKDETMQEENGKNELMHYLSEVLTEAGLPSDTRKYLIQSSLTNLEKVHKKDIHEKKELLKKNLYVLLINLASKKPLLPSANKDQFSTKGYELTATNFLSDEHLHYLKRNQAFNDLSINDVEMIFRIICPIWPWC